MNPKKFFTTSLIASGRYTKVKHIAEALSSHGGEDLSQKSVLDLWSYLGINFSSNKARFGDKLLEENVLKLTKGPPKPQQCVKILTFVLLSRHYHAGIFGRKSA